jgi:hypothetical protein
MVADDVRWRISAQKTVPPRDLGGYGSCENSHQLRLRGRFESGGRSAALQDADALATSRAASPGFGVRQSSGALAVEVSQPKAPEDWRSPRRYRAIRRFMVLMHARTRKEALHEPKVGRVSPLRAVCGLPNGGAHGVTRPTGSRSQCTAQKSSGLSMNQSNPASRELLVGINLFSARKRTGWRFRSRGGTR